MTQKDDTLIALQCREKALEEFKDVVARVKLSDIHRKEFEKTQTLWLDFAEQQSRERSGVYEAPAPTMASQLYAIEMEALLRKRIRELRKKYNV